MDRPDRPQLKSGSATRRALGASLVLIAGLVAACSSSYDRTSTIALTTTTTRAPASTASTTPATPSTTRPNTGAIPNAPTTTAGPTSLGSAAGLPGRLAVIALDGTLATMRADGTDKRDLSTPSPGTSALIPTWSPDANRLVWTALGINSVRARTAKIDGSDAVEAVLSPQATVFLWNSTGTHLAAMRAASNSTTELVGIDLATLTPKVLASGASLNAAWSPDGTRLVVRSGSQLLLVRPDATTAPIAVTAAAFATPHWLDDRTVVVGVRSGSTQYLSLVNVESATRVDLLTYTGTIRFQVEPARARIAYQLVPDNGGGSSSSNVSLRPQATAPPTTAPPTLPAANPNQLAVIDVTSKAVTVVHSSAVAAFAWNPTSTRLAFLTTEATDTYRWRFWNPQDTIVGPTYVPPRSFAAQYLRQFDQYLAGMRWWSPDGSAFVFAGRWGSRSGVWVQTMKPATDPVLVTDGDTAIWSPR